MAVNWEQLRTDLEANWGFTTPDELNEILVGNVSNLNQAKVILVMLVRIAWAEKAKQGINRRLRQAKNLIKNRIATAKESYENDHPEFNPNDWPNYSNTEMFAMISVYDPTIESDYNFVYGVMVVKARDSSDKVDGLLEQIISAVEL